MRLSLTLSLVVALTVPIPARGQTQGRLPRVLELPASTRAAALGDAYAMSAGDADAVFYHPGLLSRASGFGLGLQSWGDASSSVSLAVAGPWQGGGVALGVQVLQFGLPVPPDPPGGEDHLFRSGTVPVSERVASLGFGRRALGVQWGLVGKLVDERLGTSRDRFALVDVGVAREVGSVTLGLSYQGLGGQPESTTGAGPRRVTLAAGGYGQPVGIFDMGFSASLSRRSDGELLAGAGLEVGYWPINGRTFVGRLGLRRVPEGDGSPLSAGFAFWGDDIAVEWAYRPFGGDTAEGTHRFGIRWR